MLRKERKRKSAVWSHFEQISENEVKCKLCDTELVYSNSTGAMQNHLKSKHPTVTASDDASHDTSQQTSIRAFTLKECDKTRQESVTRLIVKMIARLIVKMTSHTT